MTLHHYIAAEKKLPMGSFGLNATDIAVDKVRLPGKKYKNRVYDKERVSVYQTEDISLGIEVIEVDNGYKEVKKHFNHSSVYEVVGYLENPGKSIKELFKYVDQNLSEGESIEVYSCLDGEEQNPRDNNLDVVINLKTYQLGKHIKLDKKKYLQQLGESFKLEDKQYIQVIKE
ncbi:hypothetical protein E2R55_09275 [Vibrio vulnificus]|nr:hypothetical protein E2R55_09275 [Vibrio vulnificus]